MYNSNKNKAPSFLPKGRAWSGKNLRRVHDTFNKIQEEMQGGSLNKYIDSQCLDTSNSFVISDYFKDITTVPRIFSTDVNSELDLVKLAKLRKRWITKEQWIYLATTLGFEIEIVTGQEAFENPALIGNAEKPLNKDNAKFIIYIYIESNNEEGFPYTFPIEFSPEISPQNLFDLFRSILDSNIELRSFNK